MPLANFLAGLSFWAVAIAIFFVLFPELDGAWHWAMLLYPIYLLAFLGLIAGLCLVLSVSQIFFRDSKHLAEVALGLLFWATPIVYRIDSIPESIGQWLRLNPLVPFFDCFHALLYASHRPTVRDTLLVVFWSSLSLAIGVVCYWRQAHRLVERL